MKLIRTLPFIALLTVLLMSTVPTASRQDLQRLQRWQAGASVSEAAVAEYGIGRCFVAAKIPDSVFRRMEGRTYRRGCTIPRAELRYLRLLHRDAGGRILLGEMVAHQSVAAEMVDIFRQLYEAGYPIERMRLADVYGGDDGRSMAANNTSCFNFRRVEGSARLSAHSRGMAVDINPLYNPCVRVRNGKTTVQPAGGARYADRNVASPYRLLRGDACHRLFTAHGYQWGGAWRSLKDYQHFEKR